MGRAVGVPIGVIVIVILGMPVVAIPVGAVVRTIVIDSRWRWAIDTYFGGTASE
jgi:hypothetical protein